MKQYFYNFREEDFLRFGVGDHWNILRARVCFIRLPR